MDDSVLRISCDTCRVRDRAACADCVVTFVCTRDAGDAVVLDFDEARALRRLARSGLLPELRHRTIDAVGGE